MALDVQNLLRQRGVGRIALMMLLEIGPVAVLKAQECDMHRDSNSAPGRDAEYHAMQARGAHAMGVDQYRSTHHFTDLPDGGRIELERDVGDSAGVAMIRHHLRMIASAFGNGDFSTPMFVHMREVPGSATMAAKRSVIAYAVTDLPRGGAVRMTTHDPDALAAVHQFLAFQRNDHRTHPRP